VTEVVYLAGTAREYAIDPETLRDVSTRPAELAAWLAATRAAPMPAGRAGQRRHRTDLGVAARLLGELTLAERELTAAARLAATESPAVALRARIRLANVWHWQGRYAEATTELEACVAAAATPADRAFAHQHAGRCAYDAGDVDRAAAHFQAALRLPLASGAEPALVESARLALDAADACRAGIAVAAELDRLVPAAHRRIADLLSAWGLPVDRPARFGVLVELHTLLLTGPVPLPVVAALFCYEPGIDGIVARLVADGWLVTSAHAIAATPRCRATLHVFLAAAATACERLWGRPDDELARLDEVVRAAVGTSTGPVFDELATVDVPGPPAVRLFERCIALRHHRADGHASAWRSAGIEPAAVAGLPADDPVRQQVATATNRVAARPYRPLSTVDRAELVGLLRRLPAGQAPVLP
jgi:tetratricopeptide (TPR) repeat protein